MAATEKNLKQYTQGMLDTLKLLSRLPDVRLKDNYQNRRSTGALLLRGAIEETSKTAAGSTYKITKLGRRVMVAAKDYKGVEAQMARVPSAHCRRPRGPD